MMFYAEHNRYGVNMMTTVRRRGRPLTVSAGNLYRFATRAERDAWVAEDGSHRIALTAGQARRDHATGPLTGGVWDRCYLLDGEIHEDGPERFLG